MSCSRKIAIVTVFWSAVAGIPLPAWAVDGPQKPDIHRLYRSSNLPHTHADFSMFHFVPRGDRMVEQPDKARLLFRTPDGQPDGYAQRRGSAVFYYDRTGRLVRIQHLTAEEVDRLTHSY